MKKIFHFLILPFFPEDKKLNKHWWHKLAKIVVLIATISSLTALFWIASLFYFNFPKVILDIMYRVAWLPVNFANLFSSLPIYGTLFQYFLRTSPAGPLTMPIILIIIFYFLPVLLYRGVIFISKKFYMKRVRIILPLIILGLLLFSVYFAKFQEIVNEGSYLADDHCIKVNPLIIDRKNKYIDQYNLLVANASSEQYLEAIDRYKESAKAYINGEKLWLARSRELLDSKSFNLLMPTIIKEAANYQYQMYESEYYSSFYLEQAWDEKDENKKIELSNKVIDETKKSNEAQDKYNAILDSERGNRFWMFNFIKVPESKCPAENNDIPIVPNPFAPPEPMVREEVTG